MFAVKFENVRIESYAFNRPPHQVTTEEIEDRLSGMYKKFKVPMGTLKKLSGINTRGFFDNPTRPSQIAIKAAREALEKSGISKDDIGAVFNCSVTRDYFEPSMGILVHQELGLDESVMAMDITNACIGFSNGLILMANLIETGVIKAGILTSGENMAPITDRTFRKIEEESDKISRDDFVKMLPTFTLGSGGVAMVLCHKDLATQNHRLLGSVSRSAAQFADLCVGNGDFCFMDIENLDPLMETDSKKLISSACKLGARIWPEFSKFIDWSADEVDHIICHQVGKQVNEEFYKTQGLSHLKEHTVYQDYGNLVSAAMPSALIASAEAGKFMTGDKVLLTAYGSGLNSIFTGIVW